MSRLAKFFPIASSLACYRRAWLLPDLFAGISVCVVMIPSVLAYAELAGLSPEHGLYAALAGMFAYALFASSPQVVAGPDAALTLLVASAVGPLAGGDPARAVALAGITALMGGVLMLMAALLRAGAVADFISKPVLVGYLTGAALILISTQLGKLFGFRIDAEEFFAIIGELSRRLTETHGWTLGLGAGLLVLLEMLRRFAPRVPGPLVVFLLALMVSVVLNLESRGVKVVGHVPEGLPVLRLPDFKMGDLRSLFPATIGIVMLTFPEAVLLARALAARNRYSIRPNQELMALAASNLASGLFQGFSVGASQSRTTVSDASGGKTQVVSLVAAAMLALFLVLLTPVLSVLPNVALASILIFAGIHLIELNEFRLLLRGGRRGFWLAVGVTAGVLVVGVVPGILLGVVASLIYVLGRLSRPLDVVLHEIPGTNRFHDVGEQTETYTVPGLIAYRFYAPLFFANAEHFAGRVRQLIAESTHPVRWFLIDMQAVWEIDITAAEVLAHLAEELKGRGVALRIARANRPLREKLDRMGLREQLGEPATYFSSVHAAVESFQSEYGNAQSKADTPDQSG